MAMNNLATMIAAATNVLSILTAILALVIAIRAERRSAARFNLQIELQRRTATASLRPILAIFTAEFDNNKGIVLSNAGAGTAIITDIVFRRGPTSTKTLRELFNLPDSPSWDNYWSFSERRHYLRAGKSIDLVRLTLRGLTDSGLTETEASYVLRAWQDQLAGIEVSIAYEDILGNAQEGYQIALR